MYFLSPSLYFFLSESYSNFGSTENNIKYEDLAKQDFCRDFGHFSAG